MIRPQRALEAIGAFFAGGAFPVFALALLLLYELGVFAMLLLPPAPSGLGAFAQEFRVWCLGFDPTTGRTEWAYLGSLVVPPLLVAGTATLFWWEPLRERLARPRSLFPPAAAAALVVAAAVVGFGAVGVEPRRTALSFPAETLRTGLRAPAVVLTNQRGEQVDLAALQGRVVLLTAIYASCPHTCPQLLAQAKRAVSELEPAEADDLTVLAVTLDPERDSQAVLAELSRLQDLPAPRYHLLTGEPSQVEGTLDAMGVARQRDPETGIIEHANLFLLIDRSGRLAYRLGLGPTQERWLASALRVLLGERVEAG
jgi:protein SCO1/2